MQAKYPRCIRNILKSLDLHLCFSTSVPSLYFWSKIFFVYCKSSIYCLLTPEWMLPSLTYPITCLKHGQIPCEDSQLSVKIAGIQGVMWLWDLNIKQEHNPTWLSYIIIFFFLMFLTHMRVSQMKTSNIFLTIIYCAEVVQSCITSQHNLPHAQCKSSSAYKVHKFL